VAINWSTPKSCSTPADLYKLGMARRPSSNGWRRNRRQRRRRDRQDRKTTLCGSSSRWVSGTSARRTAKDSRPFRQARRVARRGRAGVARVPEVGPCWRRASGSSSRKRTTRGDASSRGRGRWPETVASRKPLAARRPDVLLDRAAELGARCETTDRGAGRESRAAFREDSYVVAGADPAESSTARQLGVP